MKQKIYSVKIENNTDTFLNKVDVFGGYRYLPNSKFNDDGSMSIDGVRIYSDEQSYNSLLFKTISNPLRISSFEFISDNPKQLSSLITMHRGDSNGNIFTRNNLPRPTEDEKKSVINEHFLIDGFTKIQIMKFYPNTSLTIQLVENKKSRHFFSDLFKQIKRQLFG